MTTIADRRTTTVRPRRASRETTRKWIVGSIAIVVSFVVFLVPFAFILLQAMKSPADANELGFTLPEQFQLWQNLAAVLGSGDGGILRAFLNSTVLTVGSVLIMVVFSAMVGYTLQRRPSRWNGVINFFVLAGLIVPPAIVPTIWVLQGLNLFKTMGGMILIEATFGLSFCILLFRAFVATIPKELDEAAVLDGAGPIRLFFGVVLPLLKPVVITVVLVQSVAVFNDFANPLYFLPGADNQTVQQTLFSFQSQSVSQLNLLFTDVLLITIPPLVLYIFFNRQIVAGMTSGAVKG
ncbi:raffinose/stachyose/melibiose transport system permease protein [Curtobacterium luteum]|uniref:Raffinose/stachyose/melibiose transport system permease protein n=1 Tax=Curtobacterium luteum TaxID=33881 RepID=A0A8H9G6M1_9MICO|nr:raffinose/stachyose/melibiose transport system permease protein [Curtobacterium luteum]GGK92360.1 sugar ABC transporter permease [Curtobacterium luteum]